MFIIINQGRCVRILNQNKRERENIEYDCLWRPLIEAAAAAKSLQLCAADSVQPHRRQPARLPHPWDSPGKNTGVGCHFLLQCVKVKSLSRVQLFETPWTTAHQAPPSMGFSRQEYWSGLPLPSPCDITYTCVKKTD